MYFMSTALVAEMLAAPRTEREAHAAVAPFAGRPNKSREDAEMIRPWEVRRRLPQRRSRPVTSRSATSPRVCAQDVYTGLSLAREVGAAYTCSFRNGGAPIKGDVAASTGDAPGGAADGSTALAQGRRRITSAVGVTSSMRSCPDA